MKRVIAFWVSALAVKLVASLPYEPQGSYSSEHDRNNGNVAEELLRSQHWQQLNANARDNNFAANHGYHRNEENIAQNLLNPVNFIRNGQQYPVLQNNFESIKQENIVPNQIHFQQLSQLPTYARYPVQEANYQQMQTFKQESNNVLQNVANIKRLQNVERNLQNEYNTERFQRGGGNDENIVPNQIHFQQLSQLPTYARYPVQEANNQQMQSFKQESDNVLQNVANIEHSQHIEGNLQNGYNVERFHRGGGNDFQQIPYIPNMENLHPIRIQQADSQDVQHLLGNNLAIKQIQLEPQNNFQQNNNAGDFRSLPKVEYLQAASEAERIKEIIPRNSELQNQQYLINNRNGMQRQNPTFVEQQQLYPIHQQPQSVSLQEPRRVESFAKAEPIVIKANGPVTIREIHPNSVPQAHSEIPNLSVQQSPLHIKTWRRPLLPSPVDVSPVNAGPQGFSVPGAGVPVPIPGMPIPAPATKMPTPAPVPGTPTPVPCEQTPAPLADKLTPATVAGSFDTVSADKGATSSMNPQSSHLKDTSQKASTLNKSSDESESSTLIKSSESSETEASTLTKSVESSESDSETSSSNLNETSTLSSVDASKSDSETSQKSSKLTKSSESNESVSSTSTKSIESSKSDSVTPSSDLNETSKLSSLDADTSDSETSKKSSTLSKSSESSESESSALSNSAEFSASDSETSSSDLNETSKLSSVDADKSDSETAQKSSTLTKSSESSESESSTLTKSVESSESDSETSSSDLNETSTLSSVDAGKSDSDNSTGNSETMTVKTSLLDAIAKALTRAIAFTKQHSASNKESTTHSTNLSSYNSSANTVDSSENSSSSNMTNSSSSDYSSSSSSNSTKVISSNDCY